MGSCAQSTRSNEPVAKSPATCAGSWTSTSSPGVPGWLASYPKPAQLTPSGWERDTLRVVGDGQPGPTYVPRVIRKTMGVASAIRCLLLGRRDVRLVDV